MQRKHPLWFLLPLALLLPLAACSSQAPAADAPQEAAAYTLAPYAPTEQEETLLQAYELTQDNAAAFTFQTPEQDLALYVQVYRLGEDGAWQSAEEVRAGLVLPPQGEGLVTLQLEDSGAVVTRTLYDGSLQAGSAGPLSGAEAAGARVKLFLSQAQPIQEDVPIPLALLVYGEDGDNDALADLTLEDYFTPENLTGLGQVQVVTATFSAAGL